MKQDLKVKSRVKKILKMVQEVAPGNSVELRIPPLSLCTDNGAMIAVLGSQLIQAGAAPSSLAFSAESTLDVRKVQS